MAHRKYEKSQEISFAQLFLFRLSPGISSSTLLYLENLWCDFRKKLAPCVIFVDIENHIAGTPTWAV